LLTDLQNNTNYYSARVTVTRESVKKLTKRMAASIKKE